MLQRLGDQMGVFDELFPVVARHGGLASIGQIGPIAQCDRSGVD